MPRDGCCVPADTKQNVFRDGFDYVFETSEFDQNRSRDAVSADPVINRRLAHTEGVCSCLTVPRSRSRLVKQLLESVFTESSDYEFFVWNRGEGEVLLEQVKFSDRTVEAYLAWCRDLVSDTDVVGFDSFWAVVPAPHLVVRSDSKSTAASCSDADKMVWCRVLRDGFDALTSG